MSVTVGEKDDFILEKFAEIEFSIESLSEILKSVSELYEGYEQMKIMAFLNVTIRNLDSIRNDIRDVVNELDEYFADERKKKRTPC